MSSLRLIAAALLVSSTGFLVACADSSASAGSTVPANQAVGNPITGEGLPSPAPNVVTNWGTLPEGREWGSTAGIDIDPTDGHIWAYERCGASSFGGGVPVNCDSNPVDPVFKFDRHTGEILANFGGGLMVIRRAVPS